MSPSDVSQKLHDANKQLDLSFSVDGSGRARGHDGALQYQLTFQCGALIDSTFAERS